MTTRIIHQLVAGAVMVFALESALFASQPEPRADERLPLAYFLSDRAEPPRMAFWQAGPPGNRGGERRGVPGGGPPRGPAGRPSRPNGPANGRPPIPPRMVERLRNMKPAERERVLENNRRFQELPPERQAELRERLRLLMEMSPDQRQALDRRLSVFRNMRPEQQRKAREIYEKHWRNLSPERRMVVLDEFRNLRGMSADERGARVTSDDYQNQFNSEERALLDELSAL